MPLYFSMKVTAFKTWKETHQSENLWKGGVALHGWCQKGSTFNFAHGAVEPCMWALSADAGKWLVLCLYGYHKKKINVKLEVSQHGQVVCFQLCGNIFTLSWSDWAGLGQRRCQGCTLLIWIGRMLLKWGQSGPPCTSLYWNSIKTVIECNICTEVRV